MRRKPLIPVFVIHMAAVILSSVFAFGQPMRTTSQIILYSQPGLKAPAPTYPPVNSLLIIKEKANDQFWKVLYKDNPLYMHESSRQYCVPADSPVKNIGEDAAKKVTQSKGIKKPLQMRELLQRQKKLAETLIITGSVFDIFGAIEIGRGIKLNSHGNQGDAFTGKLIGGLGVVSAVFGTALIVTGSIGRTKIMKRLSGYPVKVVFNPYSSVEFNHHSTGLSLTITF